MLFDWLNRRINKMFAIWLAEFSSTLLTDCILRYFLLFLFGHLFEVSNMFSLIDSENDAAFYHNKKRDLHVNTQPLKGSKYLATVARKCAEIIIEGKLDASSHPCKPGIFGQGENIRVDYTESDMSNFALRAAVDQW